MRFAGEHRGWSGGNYDQNDARERIVTGLRDRAVAEGANPAFYERASITAATSTKRASSNEKRGTQEEV
jgi:hypothetical protein